MNGKPLPRIPVLIAVMGCGIALAQSPAQPQIRGGAAWVASPAAHPDSGPVDLDWAPPALAQLRAEATTKSSFTLDHTMLAAAAGMMPDADDDTRQAIAKVDGVSVHMLRFGPGGLADEASVDAIREAYHARGFKHLGTTSATGGPAHDAITDIWLVVDGVNLRGAVILVESPKSLALVTVAGDLSPVDLLHLRGHFGIPRFDGDVLKGSKDK